MVAFETEACLFSRSGGGRRADAGREQRDKSCGAAEE
jgi:hypothetical protein